MAARNFILSTAGHVDHGKSSLVKALTGTDPDRLPEEKARGITIDLGFAHLQLHGSKNGESADFHVGLVDVPGHEDFVKNMVAGVGSIDLALLVVAADDGWMPQTEEHLQILAYLGVKRAVVALTKIDLARDQAGAVAAVRTKLADSPFCDAPIVATSVVTGGGLENLKSALIDVLFTTPASRNIGKPRLPVDRVFTLRGVGVVVTGTLTGGELRRSLPVILRPSGRSARLRSIQSHNQTVEASGPGTRTALNLSDVETTGVQRGDVITLPSLGGGSDTWEVVVEKSGRTPGPVLKDRALVRIHFGSANAPARVIFLDAKALSPGERALAEVRFESPQFAFAGDRFIVRDWSEQTTLAGGIVLCPDANRRQFRSPEQRRFLETRAASANEARVLVESQIARDRSVNRAALLLKSRFSSQEISEAVAALAAETKVVIAGNLVMDGPWWGALREKAVSAIDFAHAAAPDRPGVLLADLRAKLECLPEVFDTVIENLVGSGFSKSGMTISRATHKPALPPHLVEAGKKVRAALAAKPFDPPSRKELAPDAATQQALRFLLQTNEAVEVSDEIVLLTDAFSRAREEIRKLLSAAGAASASEIRQALGTSRRVIIPLLEYLDKKGFTRREGDKRALKVA